MRPGVVVGVVMFFVVITLVLGMLLFGSGNWGAIFVRSGPVLPGSPVVISGIGRENSHAGTANWEIPPGREATTQIQAYGGATSVSPGENFSFYVSTQSSGTAYALDIYRLGWYAGLGGRLMFSLAGLSGEAQGYYESATHALVHCGACRIDSRLGLVEANWSISYTLAIPLDWMTGLYLAKFTDAQGMQTYVPFDVRGNGFSRYVLVTPDTTYAAYNAWGGYSLYAADGKEDISGAADGRAVKVSFDRPYAQDDGSAQALILEADTIRWLERQGYDLSYVSNVDVHEHPSLLLHHQAYLSVGHDEYWTKEMREGVEAARNSGIGLAFLGANAMYWQMRFEPDSHGIPDRTIVCYKVQTVLHDLARDPLYGKDTTRVTAQWRDPVLLRPENALIGIMYSNLTQGGSFPWHVTAASSSYLMTSTGLEQGKSYGCNLVGYEWDRVFSNGYTPRGLQILAASGTISDHNTPDYSNTTYYIAASGAFVFATGSLYWTEGLDDYRFQPDPNCRSQDLVVPGIQRLLSAVMQALIVKHA